MSRSAIAMVLAFLSVSAFALMPVNTAEEFYQSISYSPDIKLGEWNGRCSECVEKAKETGYLMFWMLSSLKQYEVSVHSCERTPLDARAFIEANLGRQSFCDLINDYKYIILCYGDYSDVVVKKLKDSIYGCDEKSVYSESAQMYIQNHNGYPIKHDIRDPNTGRKIGEQWCDDVPSLHLIKFESNGSATILFHVYGKPGTYDVDFSPYYAKFTIPYDMNNRVNMFAPWFKLYLDMYPISEQISEYKNKTVLTRYVYETITLPVTETITPTYEQIALHRDNILFRQVTMLRDIAVKRRIGDVFTKFDDKTFARNHEGKWYMTYDDTISAVPVEISDNAVSMEMIPSENCTFSISQRYGNGFTVSGYDIVTSSNITNEFVITIGGSAVFTTLTNETVNTGNRIFVTNVTKGALAECSMLSNKLYRISSDGAATFDTFYTK